MGFGNFFTRSANTEPVQKPAVKFVKSSSHPGFCVKKELYSNGKYYTVRDEKAKPKPNEKNAKSKKPKMYCSCPSNPGNNNMNGGKKVSKKRSTTAPKKKKRTTTRK